MEGPLRVFLRLGWLQVWLQQIKCSWRENPRIAQYAMKLSEPCRDLLDKVGKGHAPCLSVEPPRTQTHALHAHTPLADL